jgi:hypothetical protein
VTQRLNTQGGCLAASLTVVACLPVGCGRDAVPHVVPGPERRAHLREMKDRVTEPAQLTPMLVADLIALPRFPRAYTRVQLAAMSAKEHEGVTVTGYLTRLRPMEDGDYRLELTATLKGRCFS